MKSQVCGITNSSKAHSNKHQTIKVKDISFEIFCTTPSRMSAYHLLRNASLKKKKKEMLAYAINH